MRWFVLMAGLFTPFAVSAAELETHSKIEAVTLFPNSALVSRVAEVDLPAGETTVLFDNLPSGLDPASVQVSAQASGNVVLGLVSGRVIGEEPKPNNAAEVRLKELHSLRDGWQAKLEALARLWPIHAAWASAFVMRSQIWRGISIVSRCGRDMKEI